jgi:AraC-like DNA-binding protein
MRSRTLATARSGSERHEPAASAAGCSSALVEVNSGVQYVGRVPAPPLAAHVAELWHLADAPPHRAARLLPAGTLELVFDLDDDQIRIQHDERVRRYEGAVVSGAYRSYFSTDTRMASSRVGVHFRPGGAWWFLGVPPGELADTHVDLSALWGARGVELRERLCRAATPELRFDILERALLERFTRGRTGHLAVPRAIAALEAGGVRIADVAAELGISHRRLVDVFTAEVGIGPKAFARIARVRRTLALARRARTRDWALLARASGYCDQSHLIREFVAITGDSPLALRARSIDGMKQDHVVNGGFQFIQDEDASRN